MSSLKSKCPHCCNIPVKTREYEAIRGGLSYHLLSSAAPVKSSFDKSKDPNESMLVKVKEFVGYQSHCDKLEFLYDTYDFMKLLHPSNKDINKKIEEMEKYSKLYGHPIRK